MKLIKRPFYLENLINVKDIPDIKIITGVRRSGKSKLLDAFYDYLINDKDNKNVIRIKLNLKKYESLLKPDNLYDYVDKAYVDGVPNYLIIDEIQECVGFERVINSLYEEERFDIYLSGSNAFMLSSDLATLFGGRYFDLKMYPFSFREFNIYYNNKNPIDSFDDYVIRGGMSGSYLYKNQNDAYQYIDGIYKKTISKDIVKRFKIENEPLLIMIADYLMDNVGNKTSIRNIANVLTSNKYQTNHKTVGLYVDYLCKSFLFYPFTRSLNAIKKLSKLKDKLVLMPNTHCHTDCQGIQHWFIEDIRTFEFDKHCPAYNDSTKSTFIYPEHLYLFDNYVGGYKLQGREYSTDTIITICEAYFNRVTLETLLSPYLQEELEKLHKEYSLDDYYNFQTKNTISLI
jgi:predicted AAA+ superfamily ATPase